MVSTVLLGGGDGRFRSTAPGSFPVDPFFFLIALTYALTVGYAVTLRLRRAPSLADRRAAGLRRAHRVRPLSA